MLATNVRLENLHPLIYTSLTFIQQAKILHKENSNISEKLQSFGSFICDNININRFPPSSTIQTNDSFDIYRKNTLEKYCGIVPIPRSDWENAKTYTEKDMAFVIFTAASFFHTRATATRDTWLSRITNYYFLSATPYPYLPVTVVPGAGEDKLSNMKKLFYGLQIIYQQQMKLSLTNRQKWFYIAGCDTFILPHHLLKRLDGLDYTKPILLGGHSGHHPCLGEINPKITVEFPSGGAGFFFSMKLLEIMQPNLTNFVDNVWPSTSEISDVALTCLAAQLGVRITRQVGFWAFPPEATLRGDGRLQFHKEAEPNNYHYVSPDEMYALDEFYVNQHMDRLIKDRNWNELVKFTRRFVSSHYELLRKKRRECTLPKVGNETKLSAN
ncbi:unnamed protein product [Rotaria sp. Silwood1]|nr:unnamed protein product [Rotaria sp. Silwood1]CAF1079670.1 unnamed protein product [Rotaria sp. Silwood1]CAF5051692.1 unnamed protein product [Rotaria sp. Silwood1]